MHQAERGRVEEGPRPDRVRMQRLERSCPPRVDESEVERLESREVELERELAELREKNAQLERFAAMAAHELLKPLIMTEAYATMIAERGGHGLDLDTRQDIDTLVRVSSRMRLLVETLLMEARARRRADGAPGRRPRRDPQRLRRDARRRHPGARRPRRHRRDAGRRGQPRDARRRVRQPALQRPAVRAADRRRDPRLRRPHRRRLDVLGREPRPGDPRARPRADLRAVGARGRRAPRPRRRPRAGARAPGGRAPRRPRRRHVAGPDRQPLLLHAAGELSSAVPTASGARSATASRASARRACAGCSSCASGPSRSRARARSRSGRSCGPRRAGR